MKKVFFIVAMILMMATGCNQQKQEQEQQNMNKENNELTAFDVQTTFEKNGFSWFTENLLVCSGDTTQSNAMTIGWGGIGNYLGHNRPAVTVYVAPGRYTWEFMEKYPRFTIMQFDDPKVWQYMGSNSGRDGDKAAALGLHVAVASLVAVALDVILGFETVIAQYLVTHPAGDFRQKRVVGERLESQEDLVVDAPYA